MSDDLHGKQPIDPVIRAALRARQVAPSDRCVDPEMLSAWVEGGLDALRAADVESHLADCARCQSILAAFGESAEPAIAGPAVVLPFAKPSPLRWIAPVAAGLAAASLVAWMVWPRPAGDSAAPASQLAERVATPAPAPESLSAAAPTPQPTPAAPSQEPRAVDRAAGQTSAPTRSAATKLGGGAAKPSDPTPPPLPIPTPFPVPPPGAAAATPIAAAPPPPPAATTQARAATAAPPTVAAQPPAKPVSMTADSAVRSDRNVLKVDQQRKYPIEFGPPASTLARQAAAGAAGGRGGGGGRAAAGAGGVAAKPMMTNEASASPTRWRILETGRVERTVNSGQTWTGVPLDGPAFITAGAAASPTVCWLVGHDGVVFRSIDGVIFVRVFFPDAIDLTTVTTQDADRATVGTRDGRVFTTTDGGLTWRLY